MPYDRDRRKALNPGMNLLVTKDIWNVMSKYATVGFSRRPQLHGV
jgi:hypothetical protein